MKNYEDLFAPCNKLLDWKLISMSQNHTYPLVVWSEKSLTSQTHFFSGGQPEGDHRPSRAAIKFIFYDVSRILFSYLTRYLVIGSFTAFSPHFLTSLSLHLPLITFSFHNLSPAYSVCVVCSFVHYCIIYCAICDILLWNHCTVVNHQWLLVELLIISPSLASE